MRCDEWDGKHDIVCYTNTYTLPLTIALSGVIHDSQQLTGARHPLQCNHQVHLLLYLHESGLVAGVAEEFLKGMVG